MRLVNFIHRVYTFESWQLTPDTHKAQNKCEDLGQRSVSIWEDMSKFNGARKCTQLTTHNKSSRFMPERYRSRTNRRTKSPPVAITRRIVLQAIIDDTRDACKSTDPPVDDTSFHTTSMGGYLSIWPGKNERRAREIAVRAKSRSLHSRGYFETLFQMHG